MRVLIYLQTVGHSGGIHCLFYVIISFSYVMVETLKRDVVLASLMVLASIMVPLKDFNVVLSMQPKPDCLLN